MNKPHAFANRTFASQWLLLLGVLLSIGSMMVGNSYVEHNTIDANDLLKWDHQ